MDWVPSMWTLSPSWHIVPHCLNSLTGCWDYKLHWFFFWYIFWHNLHPPSFVWLFYCHIILPACILLVSFCALTPLFFTVQVIYKKFAVPCPFVDFAFNVTASGLNVTDPGGDDDPSCVPKMANLNTQVRLRMLLSMKLQIHFHCLGHWHTPTYVIVIFSMLPVTQP